MQNMVSNIDIVMRAERLMSSRSNIKAVHTRQPLVYNILYALGRQRPQLSNFQFPDLYLYSQVFFFNIWNNIQILMFSLHLSPTGQAETLCLRWHSANRLAKPSKQVIVISVFFQYRCYIYRQGKLVNKPTFRKGNI